MKTMKRFLAVAVLSGVLAGCTDASAKLPNSSQAVVKVGSDSVTRQDLYDVMFAANGANTCVSKATKTISDLEIEITDDMKTSAQQTIDYYNMMYGNTFAEYLASSNMTEEDYMNDYLIPSQQASELIKKYIDENFDELVEKYQPIMATVLTFTSKDDADAALSDLKDNGMEASEAASSHNSSSTGTSEMITMNTTSYDASALSVIRSGTVEDGWIMVPSSDGATFYVLRIDNQDASSFKEDVLTTLSSISAVSTDSTTYWFTKYNFHVYDIDLYNALESSDPTVLVQEK